MPAVPQTSDILGGIRLNLSSLTVSGFRCFDADGQVIDLDDLTCFVGPNASGKTSAMMALARLFGEVRGQRQITPTDFHLAPSEQLKDRSPRSLYIECRLDFPELDESGGSVGDAVPEAFNQMIVGAPDGSPYCRIRLEATWTADGTADGDIEQKVFWILTDSDDPDVIDDDNRKPMRASDRGRIRVVYVPAARDPERQIKGTTNTVFKRLLDAIAWDGADDVLQRQLDELQNQLASLKGVQTINEKVQEAWANIYKGRVARNVTFRAIEEDPTELLKHLVATFQPSDDNRTMASGDLSDGLRSLFSLSLTFGLFEVEQALRAVASDSGFSDELTEQLPTLTVFAVEEPENHLSPHYLGSVVAQLSNVAQHAHAQVLLTSHSPSILSRVEPDNVRYFLGSEVADVSEVRALPLPEDDSDESFKFVREAIRGYPELYFARLVIFGEGPSEEIVLKRVFEASGTPLDTHFISVVPLGGRHVNHFWRLLHGLGIPYLTLLDLDREKEGAGWGRIQYVRNQLVKLHGNESPDLYLDLSTGNASSLADDTYDDIASRDVSDTKRMDKWLVYLRKAHDVYFSTPLDLDFSLLESFPDVYKAQAGPPRRGPSLPDAATPEYADAVDIRLKQILAAKPESASRELGATYSRKQKELFPWYKYLFVDGSKPVSHMRAMIEVEDEQLLGNLPEVLKSLVDRAKDLVTQTGGAG